MEKTSRRLYIENIINKCNPTMYYRIELKDCIATVEHIENGKATNVFTISKASAVARHIVRDFDYYSIDNIIKNSGSNQIVAATFKLSCKLLNKNNIDKNDLQAFAENDNYNSSVVSLYAFDLLNKINRVKLDKVKTESYDANTYRLYYGNKLLGKLRTNQRKEVRR